MVPFVNQVSECIREMHEDGTLHALASQYLQEDYTGTAADFDYDAVRQY